MTVRVRGCRKSAGRPLELELERGEAADAELRMMGTAAVLHALRLASGKGSSAAAGQMDEILPRLAAEGNARREVGLLEVTYGTRRGAMSSSGEHQ